MKSLYMYGLIILLFSLYSCGSDETTQPSQPTLEEKENPIDLAVKNGGALKGFPEEKRENIGETKNTATGDDGLNYDVTETKWHWTKNTDTNIICFNLWTSGVPGPSPWPGEIVNGKELMDHNFKWISDSFPRKPLTLFGRNGTVFGSREMQMNNSFVDYMNNYRELILKTNGIPTAKTIFKCVEAYSLQQACMEFGINDKWFPAQIRTQMDVKLTPDEKCIYIYIRQDDYTIYIDEKKKASEYFGDSTDVTKLKMITNPGNPLCIVTSATYGKYLLLKLTYKGKKTIKTIQNEINNAIKFEDGDLNYVGGLDDQRYTFTRVTCSGYDNTFTFKNENNPSILKEFLKNDLRHFNINSTYTGPISCTVKNLADNSYVTFGSSFDYTSKEYALRSNGFQELTLNTPGFFIYNDCEPQEKGRFSYSFDIVDKDNNSLINGGDSSPKDQPILAGDEEWVTVSKDFFFKLPKSEGETFRVIGKLTESNSQGNDSTFTFEHVFTYPWEQEDFENDYNPKSYIMFQQKSNLCRAGLQLFIKRK